jgi:hypothetical protein
MLDPERLLRAPQALATKGAGAPSTKGAAVLA